jgi:hypothetical protein
MIEINNGKTKKLMGLLAQDETLAIMRAMRTARWYTAAELSEFARMPPLSAEQKLCELSELGIMERAEGQPVKYKLLHRRIQLNVDVREIPPGPGYILDVVRFYNHLLTCILDRTREAGGEPASEKLLSTFARVRSALPERERQLLMCVGTSVDFMPCLERLEMRIMEGKMSDDDVCWVRKTYLRTLQAIIEMLESTLDETMAKLVFRLAAREPIMESRDLVTKFALLDAIPENYVRLV